MSEKESGLKRPIAFFKEVFQGFSRDDCPRLAAAIAYYTTFALPPLLVFIVLLLGLVVDGQQVQEVIGRQMQGIVGEQGAGQIREMTRSSGQLERGGSVLGSTLGLIVGIGALVFSASGAFLSLQSGLNTAWQVRPDPRQGGIRNFLFKRLISLGMVLGIAFLLLVTLAISGFVAAFGEFLGTLLPEGFSTVLLLLINSLISIGVFTLLFAAMFKILPDATVAWRDVWVGAAFTAFLFVVGMSLIGLYLGRGNPGSAFGAAGSLALILLWIYFTATIVLIGAEFTQVWVNRQGKQVRPEPGAVHFRVELVRDEEVGRSA